MARHRAGEAPDDEPVAAWTPPCDHEPMVAALRDCYASIPVPPVPTDYVPPSCSRCGSQRLVDYRAKVGCGSCGHLWQAESPLGARERYTARRRLDERAERP